MSKIQLFIALVVVVCLLFLRMNYTVIGYQIYQKVQDSTLIMPVQSNESMLPNMKSIYENVSFDGIFKGFNNHSGTINGSLIVPNIVHFLRFNLREFSFVDTICVLAAYRNLRPEKIMFHTNVENFEGSWWDRIRNTPGIKIEIVYVDLPDTIFGQKFSKVWHLWHSGDVTRIRILMKYGGIFLDNDVYVVKSFDLFRRYEMVLGWDQGSCLGTQVIVAHKDARFLRFWLESYREYFRDQWYYNAGCKPTEEVLNLHPELVHRVKRLFGVHILITELYKTYWDGWRNQYAIHLLINHRSYLDKEHYDKWPKFNESNIIDYNMTFGEMAREIYRTC